MLEIVALIAVVALMLEVSPAYMMSRIFVFANLPEVYALTVMFAIIGFLNGTLVGEQMRQRHGGRRKMPIDNLLLGVSVLGTGAFLLIGFEMCLVYATVTRSDLTAVSPVLQASTMTALAAVGIVIAIMGGYYRESFCVTLQRRRLRRLRVDLPMIEDRFAMATREAAAAERAFHFPDGEDVPGGGVVRDPIKYTLLDDADFLTMSITANDAIIANIDASNNAAMTLLALPLAFGLLLADKWGQVCAPWNAVALSLVVVALVSGFLAHEWGYWSYIVGKRQYAFRDSVQPAQLLGAYARIGDRAITEAIRGNDAAMERNVKIRHAKRVLILATMALFSLGAVTFALGRTSCLAKEVKVRQPLLPPLPAVSDGFNKVVR